MNNLAKFKISYAALALMLLMLVTRFHHFGSAIALPDASLAVFFLAGLWVAQARVFVILLVEAALIDYVAITQMGVSSYCVSPAYVFLIPTYGVLWLAGRHAQQWSAFSTSDLLRKMAAVTVATTAAFGISNGSFYMFSEKFPDMSYIVYLGKTGQYFQPYLTSTLIYCIAIVAVVKLVSNFAPRFAQVNKPL